MNDETLQCGNPSCTKTHTPKELADRAVVAVVAVQRGQRRVGLRGLALIAERWGVPGMVTAARMWCTLVVHHTSLKHADVDRLDGLAFSTLDEAGQIDPTSPRHDVDDVEPGWRWAGRFLLAVKVGDVAQLEALVGSLQHDSDALTDAVAHLLLACGAALANPDRILVEVGD